MSAPLTPERQHLRREILRMITELEGLIDGEKAASIQTSELWKARRALLDAEEWFKWEDRRGNVKHVAVAPAQDATIRKAE